MRRVTEDGLLSPSEEKMLDNLGARLGIPSCNSTRGPTEELEFVHGVATRTLSIPGYYYYGTGGGFMWYEEEGVVRVF